MLEIERHGPITHVWLARTDARNALDTQLIADLAASFGDLGAEDATRVIVLGGRGPDFCAGADIRDMRAAGDFTREQNIAAATTFAALFAAIYDCPKPVIVRCHGGVYGGGVGLTAAGDIPVAATSAVFSLSEVRLGILPAMISPYVVRRIGERHARELFLTGERFDAVRAGAVGLVQHVVADEELDAQVATIARRLLDGAPLAQARIKRLVPFIATASMEDARQRTPQEIADQRATPEAREGLTAFLEKRKASWAPQD